MHKLTLTQQTWQRQQWVGPTFCWCHVSQGHVGWNCIQWCVAYWWPWGSIFYPRSLVVKWRGMAHWIVALAPFLVLLEPRLPQWLGWTRGESICESNRESIGLLGTYGHYSHIKEPKWPKNTLYCIIKKGDMPFLSLFGCWVFFVVKVYCFTWYLVRVEQFK